MASPQIENGYIKIANELFDALCKIRISGETRQVFDVILRKTYGFNKIKDIISYSQFSKFTGIGRQGCIKAIRKLIEMNLITVTNNGNSKQYGINKDFEAWKPLPKKVTITNNGNKVLPKKVTKVLPKMSHTKDNKDIFKDNRDAPTIWRSIFPNKTPGLVEIQFVEELKEKHGAIKAGQILFNFREQNFHSIRTMRESLNEDGTIKPRPSEKSSESKKHYKTTAELKKELYG